MNLQLFDWIYISIFVGAACALLIDHMFNKVNIFVSGFSFTGANGERDLLEIVTTSRIHPSKFSFILNANVVIRQHIKKPDYDCKKDPQFQLMYAQYLGKTWRRTGKKKPKVTEGELDEADEQSTDSNKAS